LSSYVPSLSKTRELNVLTQDFLIETKSKTKMTHSKLLNTNKDTIRP